MINFNEPPYVDRSIEYIQEAVKQKHLCGDGIFTTRCSEWIEQQTGASKCLMTTSCTHALEMAAYLIDIQPGDEVIVPSYTFASTADAFALRGARIVFVDIRPDTMNIDENLIEEAITAKTKAICVVHYAGVACEMDVICDIASRYNLFLIEDAAQALMSTYKDEPLGAIGDFGCFSFHETKNYSMGEGGALVFNDKSYIESAEVLREKGTDRSKFWRGEIDKYSWVDIGSSYLPSELNTAYLWAQLEEADEINAHRLDLWNRYFEAFKYLANIECIDLPSVPESVKHNGHMFYIKCKDENERAALIQYLGKNDIKAVFHYIPLHTAKAGKKYGRFAGKDIYTTKESLRLLRLPLHNELTEEDVYRVIEKVKDFYI